MDNLDRYITQEARRFIDIVEKESKKYKENKEELNNNNNINLDKIINDDKDKGKSKCC